MSFDGHVPFFADCVCYLNVVVMFRASRFMPCLKYIVQNAIQKELRMLRGKTIECISLIGLAVSKDKVKDILL